ncbi:MAG: thymidylate synthase [Candidatus Atribacteria bacterium]|nr:thymidylate synthase [Candidatus Atribacteria bacterium]
MKVNLLTHTPCPELVVARAARICYSSSFPIDISLEESRKLIKRVLKRGHESVLEHVSFTFLVEGISRAASHQLVRHRLASYSQQSQRYVFLGEPQYVVPPSIKADPRAKMLYEEGIKRATKEYNQLVELGIPKEDARYLFPQAVSTSLVFTANARELLHILRLRLCGRAQWEIRELASLMLEQVRAIAPSIFENAGPPCIDGPCPEGEKGCGKPWKTKK